MAAASAPARARQGRILVASPCAEARGRILRNLPLGALESAEAIGGADALMKLEESQFHTLVLDPKLDDLSAEELVSIIRSRHPELKIVMLDRQSEEHPISLDYSDETRSEERTDENAMSFQPQGAGLEYAPELVRSRAVEKPSRRFDPLPGMIGSGLRMQHLYRLARLVAPRDTAVLIIGATGTGKELVAHGIHGLSRGSRGPFVVVNCAAIPESLLEAELFGFTRGAFTGAFQSRLGRIHAAHGGTLLLDEVGELPLSMQAKLLRFVQEGEVQRLGSADMFRVDARIIAATNANLFQRVREKQFREDLY
jgi:DNA-binding NtrC family response regulator